MATGGGTADDNNQFFDVDGSGGAGGLGNNGGGRTPLTEEERENLQQELKKTDDEIATLRQVLTARLKYSNDIKRKLGVTPWVEVQQDLTQGIKQVKDSQAYHQTQEALSNASAAVTSKLGQIRSSNAFKSFEDRVGSAYNNVKKSGVKFERKVDPGTDWTPGLQAKIVASTSIDQLAGRASQTPSAAGTQPPTPSTEKPSTPMK